MPGFEYLFITHAYVPEAHFDEIAQQGNWTFGRKDNGYFALYSHLPTAWDHTQPEVFQNGGLNFDLVADGMPNFWIVECASASDYASFSDFQTAITSASITATPLGDLAGDGFDDGFDVVFESPSQGVMTFGFNSPLTVNGQEIQISDYPRYDNPFVQTEFDGTIYRVKDGNHFLNLNFGKMKRGYSQP